MANNLNYLQSFMTILSDNKLDETRISLSRLQALRTALQKFIMQFKDNSAFANVRKNCADLSIRLMKVQEASANINQLQNLLQDEYFQVRTLNLLVDAILFQCSQMISEQRKETKIIIQDPTGTTIGRLLAKHFTDFLQVAAQNAPAGTNLFMYFINKGGFSSTLYETVHVPEKQVQEKIYTANFAEVTKLFPAVSPDQLEEEFRQYLFSKVTAYLQGTCFQYSESMSKAQEFKMLWIREMDTIQGIQVKDFQDLIHEERIYINTKPEKALDTIRFVAATLCDFLKNNPTILPFIYFKFKIHVLLTEYDRADTCICYLKIHKNLTSHVQQVTKAVTQRLSKIPDDYLNKMTSVILKEMKPGVTTAADHDVRVDKGQSYTSQLSSSFWDALKPHASKQPQNTEEIQRIAQQVIIATVEDLRKRNYPIQ